MKVIIAGATGYIGQEILSQCIAHPSITSIIALTRRDLDIKNDKLRTHLMKDEDFLSYSDPKLREELKGASACLWSIGLRPSHAGNDERTRVISVDYPAAAAANMTDIASTSAPGGKLRFVYISGSGVERDQNKSLWYMGNFRRLRGESENVLLRHAQANPDAFEAYIMRPGLVPSTQGTLRDRLWGMFPSVRMDLLARAMLDIAINGNKETTIENQTINEWP
ncbi:putative nucleoside-diphosphate-sugar epimerase [Aspergillus puulaauensis]|uniref:NAD(P)-binding domain-containing protein n=1 Tax=Aspergillus puulaauensis TaxID=1220207 RepID=A0A7R8AGL6_9EURO|nr:uncharacterized protein APUU_10315S [Aspergillus puulaauensis]BCS17487.1 hypothetical protein APUU_10315S [Aspergillus puulaauensis]